MTSSIDGVSVDRRMLNNTFIWLLILLLLLIIIIIMWCKSRFLPLLWTVLLIPNAVSSQTSEYNVITFCLDQFCQNLIHTYWCKPDHLLNIQYKLNRVPFSYSWLRYRHFYHLMQLNPKTASCNYFSIQFEILVGSLQRLPFSSFIKFFPAYYAFWNPYMPPPKSTVLWSNACFKINNLVFLIFPILVMPI
jgi:hypothetical protein